MNGRYGTSLVGAFTVFPSRLCNHIHVVVEPVEFLDKESVNMDTLSVTDFANPGVTRIY